MFVCWFLSPTALKNVFITTLLYVELLKFALYVWRGVGVQLLLSLNFLVCSCSLFVFMGMSVHVNMHATAHVRRLQVKGGRVFFETDVGSGHGTCVFSKSSICS